MKFNKDFEIVQKNKIWFVISLCIVALGLIMFSIFSIVGKGINKGFNFGIDFTGGTQLDVEMGSLINNDNKEEIKNVILTTLNDFDIKDRNAIREIDGGYTISYRADTEKNNLVLNGRRQNNDAYANVKDLSLKARLIEKLYDIKITNASAETPYDLIVVNSQEIEANIKSSPTFYILLFVLAAWILIMGYVAFRFELSSAIAALIGLMHDFIILFAFAAIFHLQINFAFFGALIALVCYSIYNTVIVFDRIRENARREVNKDSTASQIVNKSVMEIFKRVAYTTIAIAILIASLVITGIPSIIGFAFFTILVLLTGTYSSLFVVPSAWALYKTRQRDKKGKSEFFKKKILFKKTEKTESLMQNEKDE